ncbi:zinc protease [Pseudomonas vancouverensis]|nr:zinc protease [Pseudomonas vancouverensis]
MLQNSAEQKKILEGLGGQIQNLNGPVAINAITLPSANLQVAFEAHARLMTHTLTDSKMRESIENLILRRKKNARFVSAISFSPELEALIETGSSTYKPAVGFIEQLEQLSLEKIRVWHQRWFGPNNALLVVAGDVTADKVKQLAEAYFGGIERGNVPDRPIVRGQQEPGYRQITQQMNIERPLMQIIFNTPSLATTTDVRSVRALEVLSALLSHCAPESLRSTSKLPDTIFCSFPLDSRSNTRISFAYEFEGDAIEAEAGFWRLLDHVKYTLFSDEEIGRAVETLCKNELVAYDTLQAQSMDLGWAVAQGTSIDTWEAKVEQLQDITASDIQQAAQMLLKRERASVGHMFPMKASSISDSATDSVT